MSVFCELVNFSKSNNAEEHNIVLKYIVNCHYEDFEKLPYADLVDQIAEKNNKESNEHILACVEKFPSRFLTKKILKNVLNQCDTSEKFEKERAIRALRFFSGKEITEKLLFLLKNENKSIKETVVEILSRIEKKEMTPEIIQALKDEKENEENHSAIEAYGRASANNNEERQRIFGEKLSTKTKKLTFIFCVSEMLKARWYHECIDASLSKDVWEKICDLSADEDEEIKEIARSIASDNYDQIEKFVLSLFGEISEKTEQIKKLENVFRNIIFYTIAQYEENM